MPSKNWRYPVTEKERAGVIREVVARVAGEKIALAAQSPDHSLDNVINDVLYHEKQRAKIEKSDEVKKEVRFLTETARKFPDAGGEARKSMLESIIEPLLEASAPFNQPGKPADVLRAYIRSKIRISRELPFASKVFASEIMHGAPHLSADQTAQLNAQAKHNISCIQGWIDQGLMAKVDPHHLLFSIWAATQTYADFDWQISTVTGKASLDEADYEAAAQTIIRLVIKGCEIDETQPSPSEQVTNA